MHAVSYRALITRLVVVITAASLSGIAWLLGFGQLSHFVAGATILLGAAPLVVEMIRELHEGKIGIDVIAIVAIISAALMGEYAAGIVVLLMLSGGEVLEGYAQNRARKELNDLMKRAPVQAHVLSRGVAHDVPITDVRPGDQLEVRPGEVVPVDGVVVSGRSQLDESSLTGESLPVDVAPRSSVLSGAVNQDGVLIIKAEKTSRESQYEHIVALVREAASQRSPFVRLADQWSIPFTILAFSIAGLAWWASGDALRALEVLVVATPCPLLIATPVAIVAGMSRSAQRGIIVKNGSALEKLARLRSVAFDKTGTLTRGVPEVKRVEVFGVREKQLLRWVVSLERASNHILAQAVTKHAASIGVKPPTAEKIKEYPGRGIAGMVGGEAILVGNAAWMKSRRVQGVAVAEDLQATDMLVARSGKLVGRISFQDALRRETKTTLGRLAHLGISHSLMLTGDVETVAQKIADQLGITTVLAGLLPEDKLKALRRLRDDWRPVAMVGDGVNDAPTLAAADVGIALGARGATAASESADVVIMQNDLGRVVESVQIARRTIRIAQESIFVGIGLSTCLMLVAGFYGIRPVIGALLQEGLDVAVILNALRVRLR